MGIYKSLLEGWWPSPMEIMGVQTRSHRVNPRNLLNLLSIYKPLLSYFWVRVSRGVDWPAMKLSIPPTAAKKLLHLNPPSESKVCSQILSDVGGWTNPSEKYANVKLDHLPEVRGENKKMKPPPSCCCWIAGIDTWEKLPWDLEGSGALSQVVGKQITKNSSLHPSLPPRSSQPFQKWSEKQKEIKFTSETHAFFLQHLTLQETNISPKNGILKMIFLFPRWDMLIPWRVLLKIHLFFCEHLGVSCAFWSPSHWASALQNLLKKLQQESWRSACWAAHFFQQNRKTWKIGSPSTLGFPGDFLSNKIIEVNWLTTPEI